MYRYLSIVLALAAALVLIPTAADAEPTYAGLTHAEWVQVAAAVEANPYPYGMGYGAGTNMPGYSWAPHVEGAVVNAAIRYNVDVRVLAEIVRCESKGNPTAVNPSSGAGGLGQHLPRYWTGRAAAAGHPGGSILDPVVNADTTAWLLATQGTAPWAPWSGWCSTAY